MISETRKAKPRIVSDGLASMGMLCASGNASSENGACSRVGDRQADQATDAAEQDAFSNNLANDATAARAHRHAHSDVRAAGGATRKQQVGDVGAGNEQHDGGEDHEHLQPESGFLLQALDASAGRRQ